MRIVLLAVLMSIYISGLGRVGRQNSFVITADKHWELQGAASLYGSRIQKDRAGHYYLIINEQQRVRGIALESVVPAPKSRVDPRNFSKTKLGGSLGDASISDAEKWMRSAGIWAEQQNANLTPFEAMMTAYKKTVKNRTEATTVKPKWTPL